MSYGQGDEIRDLKAELARLREGRWTDEERKLFLFEATKASYAEGVRAGCEELSIHAAQMDVELEEKDRELTRLREEWKTREATQAALNRANAELTRLRALETTEINRLEARCDELYAENERLRGDNEVKSEAIVNLLGSIDRLREEAKTNEKTWQVNQQHIKNLEDENAGLREDWTEDHDTLHRMLNDRDAELTRLREALSRYADHDRACDARENALYACTCGLIEMIERVFPARNALKETT